MNDNYSPPGPGLPAGSPVWAYLRDSGGPSQEQSVDQQEQEVIDYCKQHGLVLVKIFRDVARSARSVVGRDEFMAMFLQVEDKSIRPRAVIVWNYARFSRDIDDFQEFKLKLKRIGIILRSLKDPSSDDPIMGPMQETMIVAMNMRTRIQISEDVKRGLKWLVNQGYSPGFPPRGYIAVKVTIGTKRDGTPRIVSKWEPDPVLSEYVKIAWRLRAEGKSYQEITEATHGKLYTAVNSWYSFFRNKAYLGIGKSGELEIPDHHEPLITWELWEAVQKIYAAHPVHKQTGQLNHPRRVGNPTVLSGFTYCSECGNMMTHSTGKKSHPWVYYICGRRDRHGVTSCNSRRVGAVNAEKKILDTVRNEILTGEYLSEVIADTKNQIGSTAEIERQIKAERRRVEELDIAIQRLLRTIEKTGSTSAQELLEQREAEKAHAKGELDKLILQLATAETEITPAAMEIILAAWREQFDELQASGTVREVKAWLMQFVSRIELGYNKARIFYTYPMMELFPTVENSRNNLPRRGGTSL